MNLISSKFSCGNQSVPRTVVFDTKTRAHLLQWPVEEIESLRLSSYEFEEVVVKPGSVVPLDIGPATQVFSTIKLITWFFWMINCEYRVNQCKFLLKFFQLDIFAEFEIEYLVSKEAEKKENVGCGNGAFDRSSLGPFGILAIADDQLSELTPIYFHLSSTTTSLTSSFCVDETRYYSFHLLT